LLHWLIVLLLIAQFIFAFTMPHIGRNTPVTTLISLHFNFGIIILAVVVMRLARRAAHGEPTLPMVMFGYELPKLMPIRAPGWGWTGDAHTVLACYLTLTLVALHVATALYHYFVRRDGVLQRMLPG
jgi:cytochrome b561